MAATGVVAVIDMGADVVVDVAGGWAADADLFCHRAAFAEYSYDC